MSNAHRQATAQAGGGQLQVAVIVLLGVAVGLLVALLAASFVIAVLWLNDWLLISPRSRMMFAYQGWIAVATVVVPALGGLLVGSIHHFIVERRPHGPPDVIAAVQTRRGRLPLRPGLLSALSSLVSLGSGASVGQYGPLVHIGATVGSLSARLLRAGRTDDNIAIACGVAAAITTGTRLGYCGMADHLMQRLAAYAESPVTVVYTGGDAPLLARSLDVAHQLDAELVLRGVALALALGEAA